MRRASRGRASRWGAAPPRRRSARFRCRRCARASRSPAPDVRAHAGRRRLRIRGCSGSQRGGEAVERAAAPGGSCASCHRRCAPRRCAASRPAIPRSTRQAATVQDLEARIDRCRTERQRRRGVGRASPKTCSRSPRTSPINRAACRSASPIDGPARASFDRGRAFYCKRHGQMNLACAQCHDQNWGKRLLAETISQGHGTAFPAYRLEWQRSDRCSGAFARACFGVRAEMPAPGAPRAHRPRALSRWRAQGLPIEAPGVRR